MSKDDLTGGDLGSPPNIHWKKFFNKFSEIDTVPVKEWKPVHLLAYFCKLYKNAYQIDYTFKFNTSSPSKSFEVFQINKIGSILSSDPEILVKYIDWVFQTRVKEAKKKLTSISFLSAEGLVSDFKKVYLSNKVVQPKSSINRNSPLPENVVLLLEKLGLKTYGDLSFIYQSVKLGSMKKEFSEDFYLILERMKDIGFDISILEEIK